MTESVEFDIVHKYSLFEEGITIKTILRIGDREAYVDAKIDTGSTYCVFERHLGDSLGLEIETGIPTMIGTATSSFRAYGHEVALIFFEIDVFSTVYFAESEYFDRNVLGRNGWLNKIKLGLIEPEGRLFLSRYIEV